MIDANRLQRLPFRLGAILFAVAILALLLVVGIQQVQIGHQQVQIRQMRQNIDRILIEYYKFLEDLRELEARWSK
jgi:hypothetical protein